MTKEKNLFHVRGDTLAFNFRLLDYEGSLTGAYFSMKETYDSEDYIFEKTLGDGITNEGGGLYAVRVAPSDTVNAEIRSYYYDLRIQAGNDVFTVIRGILTLVDEVKKVT